MISRLNLVLLTMVAIGMGREATGGPVLIDPPEASLNSSQGDRWVELPDEGDPPETSSESNSTKGQSRATQMPETRMPETQPEEPKRRRIHSLGSMASNRIPGQPWRIHDATRPRPPVVAPAVEDHSPPSDAIVLFDGTDLSQWCHRGFGDELYEAEWKVVDGCLEIKPGSGNLYTIDGYASCQLHIEWQIPEGTPGTGQGRGNSGIKLMEKFEIQVLDSFENRTYADGQAGAIYGQYPPLVNAVRKPGEWQVYDIYFTAPVFENEKLVRPAFVTVVLNGVLVQNHRELPGATGARDPIYQPTSPACPLMLQDHGNPIRFRNIWIRNLPQE